MKIKNFKELAITPEREAALKIAEKGLEAIDTRTVLGNNVAIKDADSNESGAGGAMLSAFGKDFQLASDGKLIVICIGKCAAEAAETLEKVLSGRISSGVALGVGDYDQVSAHARFTINEADGSTDIKTSGDPNVRWPLKKITYHAGTHPMPSQSNVAGTRAILDSLKGLNGNDTVLFLISGGGSTLLCQPSVAAAGAGTIGEAVKNEQSLLHSLFKTGATIQEINTVRKHISSARGGYLAAAAYPAQVISIIFSDVPGNDIRFIASGPTVKDDSGVEDAKSVLKKYGIDLNADALIETPKDEKYFAKAHNMVTVSNETALAEMKKEAEALGFAVNIKNTCVTGEAREVGKQIAAEANDSPTGTVLLYSGETTVTIVGEGGNGGRNQELALGALGALGGGTSIAILSLASDGHDNGPHAGAVADLVLQSAARTKNVDPDEFLARNDSTPFFESVGDGLIETGDTGSNISDLMIAVIGKMA